MTIHRIVRINGLKFTVQGDDSLACMHRDLSCCEHCEQVSPRLVNILGNVYDVPNEDEREELLAELDTFRATTVAGASR